MKLTEEQIKEIKDTYNVKRERFQRKVSISSLARKFAVSEYLIRLALNSKNSTDDQM